MGWHFVALKRYGKSKASKPRQEDRFLLLLQVAVTLNVVHSDLWSKVYTARLFKVSCPEANGVRVARTKFQNATRFRPPAVFLCSLTLGSMITGADSKDVSGTEPVTSKLFNEEAYAISYTRV